MLHTEVIVGVSTADNTSDLRDDCSASDGYLTAINPFNSPPTPTTTTSFVPLGTQCHVLVLVLYSSRIIDSDKHH